MKLSRDLTPGMLQRIVADVIIVNACLFVVFVARLIVLLWLNGSGGDLPPHVFVEILQSSISAYARSAPLLTLICLVLFHVSGFYTYGRAYRGWYKALAVFQAVSVSYLTFGAILFLFFNMSPWFPRTVWMGGWLLTFGAVGGVRLWAKIWRATVWAEARIWGRPRNRAIRNVLVIGGAGYIGSVLVRKLLDSGYQVTVLDALVYGDDGISQLYGHSRFELIKGDLRDIEATVRALRHADAVIHLGALVGDPACALDEKLTIEINLAATRMIAEAAKGFFVQRFVFASTCSVYGASNETLDERSALKPVSLYAATKVASERLLLDMNDENFVPVILRFATVYGLSPRPRFDLVINLLAAQAASQKSITIFGGTQWRPFVHVEDVAMAILKCIEAPAHSVKGQVFNVGSDEQNFRIVELGETIKTLLPEVQVVRKGDDPDRRNYRVSFAKIRRRLNYTAMHKVDQSVLEIVKAVESGLIKDYRDARFNNYKTLSEEGSAQLLRRPSLTSIDCAFVDADPIPSAQIDPAPHAS